MGTCKNGVRWLYKLDQDFSWHSGHSIPDTLSFKDKDGKVRLIIEKDGKITVTKGYAWDGCTPKFCFYDILIGTPDGVVYSRTERPKTYYASP